MVFKATKIFAVLVCAALLPFCKSKNSDNQPDIPPTMVREIVIYKVKSDKISQFPAILEAARAKILEFPGCLQYQTLRQSAELNPFLPTENVFADWVEWKTLAEAQAAAQQAQTVPSPEIAAFFGAIDTVLTFGHFEKFKP